MGTNYYHRTNICDRCQRYDERHIGKSSGGWTFSFRGYRDPWDDQSDPRIGTYRDWLEQLEAGGKIFNEYHEEISLEDFKRMVEKKRTEKFNHTTYCQREHPEHARNDCWLDDEGHSFDANEFS